MIKFKAKYLKLLHPFMAKNEIRYYLEGIYVEPHPDGGVTLVATDGKAMICIRDIKGHCDNSRIIKITPDAIRKSGATHLTGCETFCTVDEDTQRLTIGAFYPDMSGNQLVEEYYIQPNKCFIEGKFPDWRKILPDFDGLTEKIDSAMNLNLIRNLIQMGLSKMGFNAVRFWGSGTNGVVVVQFENHPEVVALIMPMRGVISDGSSLLNLGSLFNKKVNANEVVLSDIKIR
ncbi:MAG: hypothetical protein K2Y28_15295 [Burkholderiaceae bacterium]|nr:hypothetical protein [Burkholderiaceae bacterium]